MKGGNCGTSFCPLSAPQQGGKRRKQPTRKQRKQHKQHHGGNLSTMKALPTVVTHTGEPIPNRTIIPKTAGGYKITPRNKHYLAKWKRGESIGFTMRSSLKAKGLIPRANGTYKVSAKYRK